MVDHVFPEDQGTGASQGDWDDAANFAQLSDAVGNTDYVVRGLGLNNPDYTNLTIDVGQGVAAVSQASATANNTTESRDGVSFVAEADARTGVGLSDNATNHVYLDVDLSADDTISIVVNTTGSKPAEPSLKLGEVDTSNNTVTEVNRRRKLGDAEAQSLVVNGNVDLGTNAINTVENIWGSGSGWATLRTNGQPWRVRDTTNGQDVAVFREGGNVFMPNGGVTVSSVEPSSSSDLIINSNGGATGVRVRDSTNSQYIADFKEGGAFEVPNGPVQVADGNRVENSSNASNSREMKDHTGIADTGTAQLLSTASETGKVLVVDRTNGSSAEFFIDGVNNAVDAKLNDPDAAFSTTAGNAGTTNVYYNGTTTQFEIENQTGASADYSVHLLS